MIYPGAVPESRALVSLPVAGAALSDAFRKAPTLLAGEAAGHGSNVKVWSPQPWRHSARAACWAVFLCPGAAALLWALHWRFMAPPCVLVSAVTLYFAFRRSCTVTTDDTGIAVITRCGSRALRWDEIRGASYHHRSMLGVLPLLYPYIDLHLDLHSGCVIELNLSGYAPEVQRELFALIAARARLAPPPSFVPYPQLVQQARPPLSSLPG